MAKYERFTIHERRALRFLAELPRAATLHEVQRSGSVGLGRVRLLETLEELHGRGYVGVIPARTEEHATTHPRHRRYWATRSGREAIGAPPLSMGAFLADTIGQGSDRPTPEDPATRSLDL